MYLSLGISLSCSFVTVSDLICSEVFETFVILPLYSSSEVLLSTKSPAASAFI